MDGSSLPSGRRAPPQRLGLPACSLRTLPFQAKMCKRAGGRLPSLPRNSGSAEPGAECPQQPQALSAGSPRSQPRIPSRCSQTDRGQAALSGLVGGGCLERDNGYSFCMEIRKWPGTLGPDGSPRPLKVQNPLFQLPGRDAGECLRSLLLLITFPGRTGAWVSLPSKLFWGSGGLLPGRA